MTKLCIKPLRLVWHTRLWCDLSVTPLWYFLWWFNFVTKTLTTLGIGQTFCLLTTRPSATSSALEARFWTHRHRSFNSCAHIGISSFRLPPRRVYFGEQNLSRKGRMIYVYGGRQMMWFDDWCCLKWNGRCWTCAWCWWMVPALCCAAAAMCWQWCHWRRRRNMKFTTFVHF